MSTPLIHDPNGDRSSDNHHCSRAWMLSVIVCAWTRLEKQNLNVPRRTSVPGSSGNIVIDTSQRIHRSRVTSGSITTVRLSSYIVLTLKTVSAYVHLVCLRFCMSFRFCVSLRFLSRVGVCRLTLQGYCSHDPCTCFNRVHVTTSVTTIISNNRISLSLSLSLWALSFELWVGFHFLNLRSERSAERSWTEITKSLSFFFIVHDDMCVTDDLDNKKKIKSKK